MSSVDGSKTTEIGSDVRETRFVTREWTQLLELLSGPNQPMYMQRQKAKQD